MVTENANSSPSPRKSASGPPPVQVLAARALPQIPTASLQDTPHTHNAACVPVSGCELHTCKTKPKATLTTSGDFPLWPTPWLAGSGAITPHTRRTARPRSLWLACCVLAHFHRAWQDHLAFTPSKRRACCGHLLLLAAQSAAFDSSWSTGPAGASASRQPCPEGMSQSTPSASHLGGRPSLSRSGVLRPVKA